MLLAITEPALMGPSPLQRARDLMSAHGTNLVLQIRAKEFSGRELYAWTEELSSHARETGAKVMVNDRLDVAACFTPHVGIQLPESGLSVAQARRVLSGSATVGRSVHSVEGARLASQDGADLVILSPIFKTPSKPGHPGIGLNAVRATKAAISNQTMLFALGGIGAENQGSVIAAGANGIAGIRIAWSERPFEGNG